MSRSLAPLCVLVVDDELLIRWAIAETLMSSGHTVLEAATGVAALHVLAHAPAHVDVVVLDYRLPDSNDLTLLARILRLTPGRPVFMMTAFGSPELKKAARDLGAYDVLDKPFDMQALEPLLVQACDHGHQPPA